MRVLTLAATPGRGEAGPSRSPNGERPGFARRAAGGGQSPPPGGYTGFGDVFAYACAGLTAAALVARLAAGRS
jgi:hypothetical protein